MKRAPFALTDTQDTCLRGDWDFNHAEVGALDVVSLQSLLLCPACLGTPG
jgi:hypothetical protein